MGVLSEFCLCFRHLVSCWLLAVGRETVCCLLLAACCLLRCSLLACSHSRSLFSRLMVCLDSPIVKQKIVYIPFHNLESIYDKRQIFSEKII